MSLEKPPSSTVKLQYIQYTPEKEDAYLSQIRDLISKDLSEPYSIYVYRYFLAEWGDLCFLVSSANPQHHAKLNCVLPKALDQHENLIGVVICKLERHKGAQLRGYIAMLVVLGEHRGKRVATKLVKMAIEAMISKEADEVCHVLLPPSFTLTPSRSAWRPRSSTRQQ